MLDTFIQKVTSEIIDPVITLLALAAFAVIVFGVVMFIQNAGDEEKRSTGKRHMMWGIVGLAIIFGARAIVSFLNNLIN